MTTTTKPRIALYARVSTKEHGQNPETQLVQLREWASRQNADCTEYVDQASGKDLNRPAWKQLSDDWRRNRVDTIAVVRLDRAFRSVLDMHNCLSEWEGRGIRFASITQPVDTATPAGKLLTTMLGAVAEFERDLTSDRVREGLARARRDGKRLGRPKSRLSPARAAATLEENSGDWSKAAQALGVSESTLRRRVKKVG